MPTSEPRGEALERAKTPGAPDPLASVAAEAAQGNEAAVRRLVEALAPPLLGAVRSVFGGEHPDVPDVLQESILALLAALHSFRGECRLVYFARRIALRTAFAARRRARAAELRSFDEHRTRDVLEPDARSPHDDAVAARRRELLRTLLDDLPEAQAESLGLRVLLGFSMEEVAEATGAPLNTVRSRLRLAKEALIRRIEEDPVLAEELEVGDDRPAS